MAKILSLVVVLQEVALVLALSQQAAALMTPRIRHRDHVVRAVSKAETSIPGGCDDEATRDSICDSEGRKRFLVDCARWGSVAVTYVASYPMASHAKSYSENARNLERINAGDFSGGAVYSNDPPTEAGKKRRAMAGCKSPVAREEAADVNPNLESISEKECNSMVMSGETDFMLKALRNLDCPTCPYGIASSR